jgi:hypothetical protein
MTFRPNWIAISVFGTTAVLEVTALLWFAL